MRVTGVCAAVVDIGATWMSDLKEGVCLEAFWLNREHCCWAANDTTFDSERCTQVSSCVFVALVQSVDNHLAVEMCKCMWQAEETHRELWLQETLMQTCMSSS